MGERPAPPSLAALRLAGHVGQIALDRVATGGVAAVAELDQHVAAVRAELGACQDAPVTPVKQANQAASNEGDSRTCACCGTRLGRRTRLRRGGRPRGGGSHHTHPGPASYSDEAPARADTVGGDDDTCPDVPFAATALHAETTVPVDLLLHYASGFVQAALSDGWTPAESADASDWVSLRLAAICQLTRQAEAAATMHPDLRPTAWPRDHDHETFGA
jgi:hypothetical protein